MKSIFTTLFILWSIYSFAQNNLANANDTYVNPKYRSQLVTIDSVTYLGGSPIAMSINKAELVFEGRTLPSSRDTSILPRVVFTYHRVLVLKQFKGKFISDTIIVAHYAGRNGGINSALQTDAKGVFFVNTAFAPKGPIHIPDVYWLVYSEAQGFIKVCDIKDVVKDLYEPIEAVTGQPYVEVHPNNCSGTPTQKK